MRGRHHRQTASRTIASNSLLLRPSLSPPLSSSSTCMYLTRKREFPQQVCVEAEEIRITGSPIASCCCRYLSPGAPVLVVLRSWNGWLFTLPYELLAGKSRRNPKPCAREREGAYTARLHYTYSNRAVEGGTDGKRRVAVVWPIVHEIEASAADVKHLLRGRQQEHKWKPGNKYTERGGKVS